MNEINDTKKLLERYPFLRVDDSDEFSWWDDIPEGWRIAFGIPMMEELREQLIKEGKLDTYHIRDVKEKWGSLRWYDSGSSDEVQDIINKYEYLSIKTCIVCGKPATEMTKGWIWPVCHACYQNFEKGGRPNRDGC